MIIGALSSFSGKGRNSTPAPEAPDYEQLERNISGLIALWIFDEVSGSTLNDAVGSAQGTFAGTVIFGAADIAPDSGSGSIDFAGTGSAEVPHQAAFELPAFTLSIHFNLNALPEPGVAWHFCNKEQTGAVTGDFNCRIEDDGDLRVQFQVGASVLSITGHVETFTDYHLCVRADSTGYDVHLNGASLGEDAGYTGAWSTNTNPIQFAAAPFSVAPANVRLAHVALYDRRISLSEVLSLAQQTDLPVAGDVAAAVPESASTDIELLSSCTFVGVPTIVPVTQPTPDSWSVVDQKARYVAGAVAADTERSFQYGLTDQNGSSVSNGTVRVTVLNSGVVAPSNANCYLATSADTVVVSSMSALAAAVNAAPPGRHILIAAGTYGAATLTLSPGGTAANPIVIRPQGARGSVTLNTNVWDLASGSSHVRIANLYFSSSRIVIRGNNHRVTRCRFRTIDRDTIAIADAVNTRVDHCDVAGYTNSIGRKGFAILSNTPVGTGTCRNVLLDYNYCHDVLPTVGDNGQDFIGLHSSGDGAGAAKPGFIIDHNLFTRIHLPSEGELLGSKCSGIIMRFNTFIDLGSLAYVSGPRTGDEFEFRSNWVEDVDRNTTIMIRSDDALVIGNRFMGGHNLPISSGDAYWPGFVLAGAYLACRRARVIGNRMTNGQILVGHINFGSGDVVVQDTNLHLNTRDAGGAVHVVQNGATGTTTDTDSEAFVAAVKIPEPTLAATDEVGMFAPDPLCPSGPQS